MVGRLRPRRHARQPAGLSLLECLVALSLGLVVVAAVLSQLLAATRSARLQAAQAQMLEDAQIALHLLVTDLQMAGYAAPTSVSPGPDGRLRWQTALGEPWLRACERGFEAPATPGLASCAAQGASAALEVRYQADAFNTVPLSGTSRPADCLGTGLSAEAGLYFTANRWHVAAVQGRSELRCASPESSSSQPLVDHVEVLALWWGLAASAEATGPARYVKALQGADFSRVRSVRICLLMRSADAVLGADLSPAYLDCGGQSRSSTDGRLRQAFFATAALRNLGGH